MHYQVSSLEPVLKGLSLKVKAGQKVGLVTWPGWLVTLGMAHESGAPEETHW